MSMFHWHIVDQHSFPLHVDEFPEVAEMGAYSENEIYSPADVRDIISYAAEVCMSTVSYQLN
jgi:hexosaminidase